MRICDLRHRFFQLLIVLKGIDGALEIIGGFLFLFVSPATINEVVRLLTQHELSEDPGDIVANYLRRFSEHLSVSGQVFGFVYLLIHGVIKIFIILSLWKRKMWAYPVAIVFFAAFGVYQIYKYEITGSIGWILLTLSDLLIIVLTWMEYQSLKNKAAV